MKKQALEWKEFDNNVHVLKRGRKTFAHILPRRNGRDWWAVLPCQVGEFPSLAAAKASVEKLLGI